jgi:hypothetical protein
VGAQESKEVRIADYEVLSDGLFRQWCAMPTIETQSSDAQKNRLVYLPVTSITGKGSKQAHSLAHPTGLAKRSQ